MCDIQICQYCKKLVEVSPYSYNCKVLHERGLGINVEVLENKPCPLGQFEPDPYFTTRLSIEGKEALEKLVSESKPPENSIIKYSHHGVEVFVDENNKGKHRENCLCFKNCKKFNLKDRENNCPIANTIFENCVKFNIVTPVFECPHYEK